ncbi:MULTISPECIES: amidohydrolase family protein [Acidobacteriaceae]|uniref:amidohydrolase family protein n=1 Tax=Acidobacteriaceae TaxID=204434 RepID=UPI00131AF2A7|nr:MULTISPECIES: amidohydrolase family protein [Acidobacteriaceae]MDW5266060.1 amidohydrolase family protein [Edaphobacter sp.]
MKFNRRKYLKAGLLTALSSSLPFPRVKAEETAAPAADGAQHDGIVDWHTHWFAPSELALLKKRKEAPRLVEESGDRYILTPSNATGLGGKFHVLERHTNLESRIPYLKKNGVKRQIISYTIPIGYDSVVSAPEMKELLRGFNDDLAAVVRKHPDVYSGLAGLTTTDVAWSAQELERTHREHGFYGGSLPLNAFATVEGARHLAPIFEVAQKQKSHLLIHRGAASPDIPGQPTYVVPKDNEPARRGLQTDSQLAAGAITLGLSDFLDAYPDVTVQVIMLGGFIPYLAEEIREATQRDNTPDPLQRLRRIYFDPGPYSVLQRSVELAAETFGSDRILFGSDYGPAPALEPAISKIGGSSRLTAEDKRNIFSANAKQLLARHGIAS